MFNTETETTIDTINPEAENALMAVLSEYHYKRHNEAQFKAVCRFNDERIATLMQPNQTKVKPEGMVEETINGRLAWVLPKTVRVVGTNFPNEDGGPSRQSLIQGMREGEIVSLVREPANAYDPNAISVRCQCPQIGEDQIARVGYLNANLAAKLAPEIDKGWQPHGKVTRVWTVQGKGTWALEIHMFEYVG